VAQAAQLLDIRALEDVAGQRGFIAGAAPIGGRHDWGPLVAVAGGRGFTPWSRDSIDVLRGAGARVWRLDLSADEALPEGIGGLVVAGTLWPETLGELAANRQLMQHIRGMVHAGLPTIALGGGMLYFLRRLQDAYGRAHELAGVLPLEGEILGEMDEPLYLQVRAREDTVLVGAGESLTGWMLTDADIMQEVPGRAFPLEVRFPESPRWQREGVSSPTLFCARVLMHLSSAPDAARRFVENCRRFAATR
jgi:cobyrinic acid a,c-diamide synthase